MSDAIVRSVFLTFWTDVLLFLLFPLAFNFFFCTFESYNKEAKFKTMKATLQTIQQIERALKKVAAKYPQGKEELMLTDIYLQVKADSGELLAFNDDDDELTRCVVEQWIESPEEDFYGEVAPILKQCIQGMKETMESLSILKPYSFVLVDDEKETLTDLFLVDDDTVILDGDLLKGLDEDLDGFLKNLLAE